MDDGTMDALYEAAQELPADGALGGIAELARQRVELAGQLATLEGMVDEAKRALREMDEIRIPEAMSAVGMARFSLDDGTVVSVDPFVDVQIREEDRPVAYQWLEDNGFGDLIKHQVSVSFAKAENQQARELVVNLENQGFSVQDRESVHPSTLKAFVREQLTKAAETGEVVTFPDSIRIYQGKRAKLALPK